MIITAIIAPGLPTVWAAVVTVALFVTLWAVSLALRDVSIVDSFWGPAFALVALVATLTAGSGGSVRWLLVGMTALWGLRLGSFLLARFLRHDDEDPRYAAIRKRRGTDFVPYSLVVIFGTQALLVLIISLPQQIAARSSASIGMTVIPGVTVWAVGLLIETISDEQQRRFSRTNHGEDAVLDTGLWRYSRHPNKFGDFCAWWGLWLVALTVGGSWWTVVGPLVMSAILIRGTGKGDAARGGSARAAYVRRTSGFVPLP